MTLVLRSTLLAAALLASAGSAHADQRLVSHEYSQNEVVRIDGKLGVQATIGFAEDEQIENVAVGDSAKWQITPNKRANLLFVKPLEPGARTNMTVVTDRRTYFFDLATATRVAPLYMLRFTYKADDAKRALEKARDAASLAALTADEAGVVAGEAKPIDPAALNFAWTRKGDAALLPTRVYDDGQATYLLWPQRRAVPAILVQNEKGEEGPVNYAVRGDVIVLDEVPALITLRSGKAMATLANTGANTGANTVPAPAAAAPASLPATPVPAPAAPLALTSQR